MIIVQFVPLRFVHFSCFLPRRILFRISGDGEAWERVILDDFQFLWVWRSYVHSLGRSLVRSRFSSSERELWIFRSILSDRTYVASIPSSSEAHTTATPVTRNRVFPIRLSRLPRCTEISRSKETRSRTLTSASWISSDYHIFRWGCFLLVHRVWIFLCTRRHVFFW